MTKQLVCEAGAKEVKRREISPEPPPFVIPNAERDLNAMAVERQGGKERYECRVLSPERWVWGKEEKRREISPDGRDDKGGRSR